jgi:hypothetical protein
VINIARSVHGLQLGAVNVAGHLEGASFGPISYVNDSPVRLQLWASDTALANLTLTYGSRHLYWMVGGGISPLDGMQWTYGTGFGTRWEFEHAFIASDVGIYHWVNSHGYVHSLTLLTQMRLYAGWQILPRLAIFAGPSYNLATTFAQPTPIFPSIFSQHPTGTPPNQTRINNWPGLFAGLQF